MIRFDRAKGDWETHNDKTRRSVHLHHNTVYLGNAAVQLFGYGQHRYYNAMYVWDTSTGEHESYMIDGASPRYLSASGVKGDKVFVLGGKGNSSGQQSLGVRLYDDLLEIDPITHAARTLWNAPVLSGCVPAHDIVFEDDGASFTALLLT